MIMRKLELCKPEERETTPVSFKSQLRLWFDGVSDEDRATIGKFFDEHYQLRQDGNNGTSEKKCLSWIEYANNSLYRWRGEGNLVLEYDHTFEEQRKILAEVVHTVNVVGRYHDPVENERMVKERFQRHANLEGMHQYLAVLKAHLEEGNSVVISTVSDLKNVYYSSWNSDAPRDYGNPPFTPSLMKLDFMPLRVDVLRGLVGLLVGQGVEYETPRHQEVLQGILKGEITKYRGHALAEHGERKIA